jgi:tRNA1Val (adenine37-N6)-methyltransferase
MAQSAFHFKKFIIQQERCAMKVGTDAVLLGSWTSTIGARSILDIGTGTGIIALMLAQRSSAVIDAIEINKCAYEEAEQNVTNSPFADLVNVINIPLQEFVYKSHRKYDLIVTNPPFFVEASKSCEEARNLARHTDYSLSYDELIEGVISLLAEDGKLSLILPLKEGKLFKEKAESKYLWCSKITRIVTRKGKPAKRLLFEFSKNVEPLIENELLILNEDMSYSRDYLELTAEYYLNLNKFRNKPLNS